MRKTPEVHKGRRPVAVVGFAQAKHERRESSRNEVETLMPVFAELFSKVGVDKTQIDFVCSGSTDYLVGGPFSFVSALDAIGVWPPKNESHVEMDAAWALYEAWVALQDEEIETALVYGFGKSSLGDLNKILSLQLDPYVMAPMWPDAVSLAGLQAQALIDAGKATEDDWAGVARRCRKSARTNPYAQVSGESSIEELMADEYVVRPLRRHALPPLSDGAAAIILAAGEKAFEWSENPAWITGIDHRTETHALGARNLTVSTSTRKAAMEAGAVDASGKARGAFDVAEIGAPFASQESIVAEALDLAPTATWNPSGGPLAANAVMVSGLVRIGEVAQRIIDGTASRGVAQATSGPVLQANLVAVLEGGA